MLWSLFLPSAVPQEPAKIQDRPFNVLLIISDDLTANALSCYGNTVCNTPNIDRLAASGVRFTNAYCQGTYCGPSRASMMSGYYPHATGQLGYKNPRPQIGDRAMWPEYFKDHGYYTGAVNKIFHMGVPAGMMTPDFGADDPRCWSERFKCPGPEWTAAGVGETLEGNPDGSKPVVGGNTFVVVQAEGGDDVHADAKAASKAVELIDRPRDRPFWIGVGFVRPHVPFVAPQSYFAPFTPFSKLSLPEKVPGDWDDIPAAGINYKTSRNMKMDLRQQKKAIGGYYASVAYMDAQVGKVLDSLEVAGLRDTTIVVFTSDHGYHLGEHDFWAKVSLRDESARVPLIISVPGKQASVCESLVELIDLFPTTANLCGLEVPERIQGKNIGPMFDNPSYVVRDAAFSVAPMRNGFLLRESRFAFIQYDEDAGGGMELFDVMTDPKQYKNLANDPEYREIVHDFQSKMKAKLAEVRDSDLR
jgi:iduronate 2-sulfatase